jgi:hypothetical protein
MRLSYLSLFVLFIAVCAAGCKKESTTTPPVPVKQFTFFNPGGNCGGRVQNGNFILGMPLNSSKTISVKVNVVKTGAFSVRTNTVHGMSFSIADTFHTTGTQTINLTGTGTPTVAGPTTFILMASSGDTCTTYATVFPSISEGRLTCKLDGVFNDFSRNTTGSLTYNAGIDFRFSGSMADGTNNVFDLLLQHPTVNPLTTGVYTVNDAGYLVKGAYTNASLLSWIGQTAGIPQATNPFTITITAVSPTQVEGTFYGTLKENAGAGPLAKIVSEGVFSFEY